jgi:(p)ppGpp synthase/HD superfamily hydrolase
MHTLIPGSLELAIRIAVEAHARDVDKQQQPYILHPLRVMNRVWEKVGLRPDHMIVAVLHDVVEDHADEWTWARLSEMGFAPAIITALDSVTKRRGEGYLDFVRRSYQNEIGRVVKLADVNDNRDRIPQKVDSRWWQRLQMKYTVAIAILTDNRDWLNANTDLVAGMESVA